MLNNATKIGLIFVFSILFIIGCSDTDGIMENSDDISPKIVSISPSNGETDVSVNTAFTVVFSHPMDTVSVEEHFNPYYQQGGMMGGGMMNHHFGGEFQWSADHDTLHYIPSGHMMGNSTHYVEFGEGMIDHFGNPLIDLEGNIIEDSYVCYFITK